MRAHVKAKEEGRSPRSARERELSDGVGDRKEAESTESWEEWPGALDGHRGVEVEMFIGVG